jgi:hypothetical protein
MKAAILGLDIAIIALLVAAPMPGPKTFFLLLAGYLFLTGISAALFIRPTVNERSNYARGDLLGPHV